MKNDDKVNICFDDECKIRVLSPEKFDHTKELAEQCTAFVNKIADFSDTVHVLVEILDSQAKMIETEKLRTIGQRNRVESEMDHRSRQQLALQAQIAEKKAELERCSKHYDSLVRIEAEQNKLLKNFSNSDD
eukprot:CAMPEP_0185768512 /NCGR_PEP_ID=MMETSP1174-20130828/50146_1 /TAXON_ID=35687 /ORGANISM="Dictyocha speculum, Strain CCMP1381" /LENGTH=131 /DNA_ID=CAMNT_0028453229 /DNA_START=11 /DNA_END=406 /DNA_ORIENTATION=-